MSFAAGSAGIRAMQAGDWPAVSAVYAQGISTGLATFETTVPSWESFDASRSAGHRLVAELGGQVLGWAAVSPVSTRQAYAGVVEHSIYVAAQARGRGLGQALLRELIASTEAAGIWTIQSSVFPENRSSLVLHERLGSGSSGAGSASPGGRMAGGRTPS